MEQSGIGLEYPVISVNVGHIQSGEYKGKEAKSAIAKTSVNGAVSVAELGLTGDEQADLVNHGGESKAICVYNYDHYPRWESLLGHSLPHGAFGENLTVTGLSEQEIHIGDIFRIGSAIVQVSQPRQPCWKLAMKWGLEELPLLVTESGATGFYFRVLEAGNVATGDPLRLESRHASAFSVAEANRIMHTDKEDVAGIRRLLEIDELSSSWRKTLTARLNRLEQV